MKIRDYPASLRLPLRPRKLTEVKNISTSRSNSKSWLPHLHAKMVDPEEGFRGLVGQFSPAKMEVY